MFLVSIPSIYGLGFAFASIVITAREANAFVFLVRGLVMIFCGITYPDRGAARLDAERGAVAAADLHHLRLPRSDAERRGLCRRCGRCIRS